jgi:hypothetical protein
MKQEDNSHDFEDEILIGRPQYIWYTKIEAFKCEE